MVEQEECKQKLIKLYEKFKNNWDSISKPLDKLKNSRVRRDREKFLINRLSSVPEEVCCKVIQLWNECPAGGLTETEVGDYSVELAKQKNYNSDYRDSSNRRDVYTYISIETEGSSPSERNRYDIGFVIITDNITKETDKFVDIVEEWTNREMSL
tara:strand:+ start:1405 stop:1869 length:465 start_codon:yes stop_codon:yes gene_type:complete